MLDYTHHGIPAGGYLKQMKSYHLDHHYKQFNTGFGITSKFWDIVFGTTFADIVLKDRLSE